MARDNMKKTYCAAYRREGRYWLAEISGNPWIHTFGESLQEARANLREALGAWIGSKEASLATIEDEFVG